MAVLSDVDIRKTIEDNEGIIIMNMHDKNLTAVGYDFTIGFICDSDSGKMPDKVGFIYASLINCSDKPVYIKEHNQFVTMVVHELATPTDMRLPKNEGGMPMDAEKTLNSGSSNICEQAVAEAKAYRTDAWKKIERDFMDKIAAFQKKIDTEINKRKQRAERRSNICKFIGKIIFKKEFWIGMVIIMLLLAAFMSGGVDKVIQVIQSLR